MGRRVGNAVVRNRLRRRLRMLMRGLARDLEPGAYLVGVGPQAADLSFQELATLIARLLEPAKMS